MKSPPVLLDRLGTTASAVTHLGDGLANERNGIDAKPSKGRADGPHNPKIGVGCPGQRRKLFVDQSQTSLTLMQLLLQSSVLGYIPRNAHDPDKPAADIRTGPETRAEPDPGSVATPQ